MDRNVPTDTVRAAFGLGCFWAPDAMFGALDGVVRTHVGYAGGTTSSPTYENIGDHIETVRVEYDPEQIGYADLLDHFWAYHDPVRAPFKRQYQPALFPATAEQAEQARATRTDVATQYEGAITTEVIAEAPFHAAEDYHQKYKLRRHSTVLDAFRAFYSDDKAFADSPAATLANGYIGGYRAPEHLEADQARLGLPSDAIEVLRTQAERQEGWADYVQSEQG